MPVSLSNQIDQSIEAIAAANSQIANSLTSMGTLNAGNIVAAQSNTQGML